MAGSGERPSGLPGGLIAPMLATPGPVPTGPGWAFEIKFDGVRAVGYGGGRGLRLLSRNDRDIAGSYPEIAAVALPDGVVVDGEVVALDERGRPDFGRLQQRMHVVRPSAALRAQVPVQYVVFDVLRLGSTSLLDLPYAERRAVLAGLQLQGYPGVVVPDNFADTPGDLVLRAAEQQGLEGVVAKRLGSTYVPGRRSRSWVKTPIRHTAEVLVAGWSPAGGTSDVVGSLLLAVHGEGGELVYVGDVGTGFTDAGRRALAARLRALAADGPPFAGPFARARGWPGRAPNRGPVHWVAPVLVGEIEYRAFTRDRTFRHPSWRGLRTDRGPDEVGLPGPD